MECKPSISLSIVWKWIFVVIHESICRVSNQYAVTKFESFSLDHLTLNSMTPQEEGHLQKGKWHQKSPNFKLLQLSNPIMRANPPTLFAHPLPTHWMKEHIQVESRKRKHTSFFKVLMKQSIVLLYAESPIILDLTYQKKTIKTIRIVWLKKSIGGSKTFNAAKRERGSIVLNKLKSKQATKLTP